MNRKAIHIGIGTIAAVLVLLILFNYGPARSQSECFAKWKNITNGDLGLSFTNTWKNIRATGGNTMPIIGILMGRKMSEYMLVHHSNPDAFGEMRNYFKRFPASSDLGKFTFFTDYDPQGPHLAGHAKNLAPWWQPENGGLGLHIAIGTNIGPTQVNWSVFVFQTSTNTIIYTHIREHNL